MRPVGWLAVVGIGAVLLLARAEGADEKQSQSVESEVKALGQRIAALEARLKALEEVVQVSGNGVKIASPTGVVLQAGSSVTVQGVTVTVQGNSGVNLRGAQIQLNNGGRPLARVGDTVIVGERIGQITTGSPTLLGQ